MQISTVNNVFNVKFIFLYNQKEVSRIAALRGKAVKLLGPGGTVVGVGGSPSWTLAAEATALSLVSGILASAAAKQGAELLRQVKSETEILMSQGGVAFSIDDINNIHLPYPASWEANQQGEKYVHSGEEFVWIAGDFGRAVIRWSSVESIIQAL